MDSVSLFCQLHLVLIVYKLFVYKVSVTTVLSFPASGESGTAAGISAGQKVIGYNIALYLDRWVR